MGRIVAPPVGTTLRGQAERHATELLMSPLPFTSFIYFFHGFYLNSLNTGWSLLLSSLCALSGGQCSAPHGLSTGIHFGPGSSPLLHLYYVCNNLPGHEPLNKRANDKGQSLPQDNYSMFTNIIAPKQACKSHNQTCSPCHPQILCLNSSPR